MAKKFDRKTDQDQPLNPEGKKRNEQTNKVDFDEETIKDQQNKK